MSEDETKEEEIEKPELRESVVIPFPKKSKTPNPKEAYENLFAQREDEIEIIVDMICSTLIENIESAGFSATDDGTLKELCFALESIRALICKYYNIEHSFHDMARHCFQLKDGNLVFTNPKFERKIEIEVKD